MTPDHTAQPSESPLVLALLALSGGGMDAYSYLCRGGIFANAQTGNLVLFGIHAVAREWRAAARYLLPVLAFTVGVLLADLLRRALARAVRFHWRQAAALTETLILAAVALIPSAHPNIACALISFACGIQVESFRALRGNAVATTMCIGNLRAGAHYLGRFFSSRDRADARRAALYFGVIGAFVIGAVAESFLVRALGNIAILFSIALLLAVNLLMVRKT